MLKFIIILISVLSFTNCSSPISYETDIIYDTSYIFITDTLYNDTLHRTDTIIIKDIIYIDTVKYNTLTVYNYQNKFQYIKAKGITKFPMEFIDFDYDDLNRYYYFINNEFLMITKG